MSYLNIYKPSFENLSEGLKESLAYLDKSEIEKIKLQFKTFIESSRSYNKSDLSKKIDWSIILCIFDNEVKKLVNKFVVPKYIEDSNETISDFRYDMLRLLRLNIFHLIEVILKDINDDISPEELNIKVGESVNNILPSYFKVFDTQLQLTSLNPNNDPKKILIEVEKIKKYKDYIDTRIGKHNLPEEIKSFNKIKKVYVEQKEKGFDISYRKLAIKEAKEELGFMYEIEQKQFYKRFTNWNKKQK